MHRNDRQLKWVWKGGIALCLALVTFVVYFNGLHGGFLFDDFPNIVDNHDVQPDKLDFINLVRAAYSSPASDFKRPLASLSFALNFLADGMEPFGFKLTNVLIHLLNGGLVYLVGRRVLSAAWQGERTSFRAAAIIAAAWLLLPINLTAVLYVVQRMESLANLFVLLGLLGYLEGRIPNKGQRSKPWLAIASVLICTPLGMLAKETAVLLPLYAACIELFLVRQPSREGEVANKRLIDVFFILVLVIPLIVGSFLVLPRFLGVEYWSRRDFTLETRLLSESRIVTSYIQWILAPLPAQLSFYHDDFIQSTSLFRPWTTLASTLIIAALVWIALMSRRYPLIPLAISLYLSCHVLTATVLPLELIYEHRNYFASFPVLLIVVPVLTTNLAGARAMPIARQALLAALFVWWAALTSWTATAWGDSLRLAQELAWRAPNSPRAQYELGRAYIIGSKYQPTSPLVPLARAALERAAHLPGSTILPEQALIFLYSRMHLPTEPSWWASMTQKLTARTPGIQDESSLDALTQCQIDKRCDLDSSKVHAAFEAGVSHADASARFKAIYGNYAWNILDQDELAITLLKAAVNSSPNEPAYRQTVAMMLAAMGRLDDARVHLSVLRKMNVGGRTEREIKIVQQAIDQQSRADDTQHAIK